MINMTEKKKLSRTDILRICQTLKRQIDEAVERLDSIPCEMDSVAMDNIKNVSKQLEYIIVLI